MNKALRYSARPPWILGRGSLLALLVGLGLMASGSVATPSAAAAEAHVWERYTNVRFAFSICYPKDFLVAQGESDNSDGQRFLSKDGQVELRAYGSYDLSDDQDRRRALKSEFARERGWWEKEGVEITYERLKSDRFVRSGIHDGKVRYQLSVLFGDIFKSLHLEYPVSRKSEIDPLVDQLVACFHTNLPAPFDEPAGVVTRR
jgi:hypothetical protein